MFDDLGLFETEETVALFVLHFILKKKSNQYLLQWFLKYVSQLNFPQMRPMRPMHPIQYTVHYFGVPLFCSTVQRQSAEGAVHSNNPTAHHNK